MEDAELGALVARLQEHMVEWPSREARLALVFWLLPGLHRGWQEDGRTIRARNGSGRPHVELRVLANQSASWSEVAQSTAVGMAALRELRSGSMALTVTLDNRPDWPAEADLAITLGPTGLRVTPDADTTADDPALIALRRALGERCEPGASAALTPYARFGPAGEDQAVAAVRALLALPGDLARIQG